MVRLKNSGCGTIEQSIDAPDSETYRILYDGRKVGGVSRMSIKTDRAASSESL